MKSDVKKKKKVKMVKGTWHNISFKGDVTLLGAKEDAPLGGFALRVWQFFPPTNCISYPANIGQETVVEPLNK